ncbi:hypothetical protein Ait01nite_004830 [Actinoplanes italicus]|uniref:Uncharacterized protein n=1 Tax=Actinoplanes italicus TaxID=113567 RepID=A0A2T0KMG9_9ACTN|nr:hypothetical protein [Actinoplanes italicus]PRX24833.1 hypothetical protein CLV67_102613 [Actinoplanes italicus]GIE27438.1 hypothetical protein Ait01nite_004830 [Actinoplanes italicus]
MYRWFQRYADEAENSAATPEAPAPTANLILRPVSRNDHFPFEVHLAVRYWIADGVAVPDPFLVAQAGIDRRTRPVTRQYPITETSRVRRELEVALSAQKEVESTGVVAWATCLGVSSPTRFVEVVRRHEELRRQETIRDWEREAEEAEITYLSRLIDDPAKATAWWFRQHPDEVLRLPEIARIFQTLRDDLAGRARDEMGSDGDSWDEIFAEFQRRAEPSARYLLGHQLNRILTEHELGDLAARARMLDGGLPPG